MDDAKGRLFQSLGVSFYPSALVTGSMADDGYAREEEGIEEEELDETVSSH